MVAQLKVDYPERRRPKKEIGFKYSEELAEKIAAYQKATGVKSFGQAVRELTEIGFKATLQTTEESTPQAILERMSVEMLQLSKTLPSRNEIQASIDTQIEGLGKVLLAEIAKRDEVIEGLLGRIEALEGREVEVKPKRPVRRSKAKGS